MMGGGGKHAVKAKQIAEACHEVNRVWCQMHGDTSQPSWGDAPEWQKESAIDGASAHLLNPGMTPEESHDRWMEIKLKDGWVYGPMKDPDRREHPCMLPYADLPPEQRAKDLLFSRTVRMFVDAGKVK